MASTSTDVITAHVAKLPSEQRAALLATRDIVAKALPAAEQSLAWGMPAFRIDGDAVLCFDGFKKHNSLFPMSGAVIEELSGELADFEVSKGTIHFDRDRPMPARLLRTIVAMRVKEIGLSYPRKSGEFKGFYANGQLKVRGRMKGDERRGTWTWFAKDGSVQKIVRES